MSAAMYPPTDMYGRPMRVRAPGEFNPDRAFRVSVELKGLPASAQHGTSEPAETADRPPPRPMSAHEIKERRNKLATPPNRRGDTSWVAITGRDSRLAVPPAYSPAPTDEYALARSLHESTPGARSVRAPGQFHPDVSYARTLSTQGPPPNPHASHRRADSRSPRSVAFELDTPLSAPWCGSITD